MPETSEVKKEDGMDLTDALSAIERKLSEKFDQGISSLEAKIPKPKEEPEDYDFLKDDEDESQLTKKDVAELVQKTASDLQKKSEEKMKAMSLKAQRDSQAMEEFPELNQRHAGFNKKFFEEVGKEIKQRVSQGRSGEDPDLVYDAAAAVAHRGLRAGWYTPQEQVKRNHVKRNSQDDSFDVSDASSSGSEGISEAQTKFAKRFNLNPERRKQIAEKYRKK